jgi:hypothetical protein
VRGVAAFRMLSDEFGLHVFEVHRGAAGER